MKESALKELSKYNLNTVLDEYLNEPIKYVDITEEDLDYVFNNSYISSYYNGPITKNDIPFIKVNDNKVSKAFVLIKGVVSLEEIYSLINKVKELYNDIKVIISSVKGTTKESLIILLSDSNIDISDPLLYDIAKHIVSKNVASTNDISRNFNIGFTKTQDYLNKLEALSIIKTSTTYERTVLVDKDNLNKIFNK